MLEDLEVQRLGGRAFQRNVHRLQEGVEAHHAEADRALALGGVDRAGHFRRGAFDEVFQHVVEEAEHVLHEHRLFRPFKEGLGIDRREAADGRAVDAAMVDAGRQCDFRTEVRLCHLQAEALLVGRHRVVHGVCEEQVRLAGLHPQLEDLLPELAGIDHLQHVAGLRRDQAEVLVRAHGLHEGIGDVDAVMEVEALAVEVARGFADFEEFLDFRVMDVEIAGGRASAQRALADRKGKRIHHADERDDSRGLPVLADLLADRADIAPIGAYTAAVRGEPDVLGPGLDDIVERIADLVEKAGDRQAPVSAAIRQHGRRRHEPELRDIVIDALGMGGVIGKRRCHARKHVLIGLARQQIAVVEGLLAEIRQQRVARRIGRDSVARHERDLRLCPGFRLALASGFFGDGPSVGCRHGDPPESSAFTGIPGAFRPDVVRRLFPDTTYSV